MFFFFHRYKDLFFDVKTGPAPSFVFTLSLSFKYNTSVRHSEQCEPRWQMTPMEYSTFVNYSQGDDTGEQMLCLCSLKCLREILSV